MRDVVIFGLPSDPHIVRVASSLTKLGLTVANFSPVSDVHLSPADALSWSYPEATKSPPFALELPTFSGGSTKIDPSGCIWWMRNKARVYDIKTEDDQRHEFEINSRQTLVEGIASSYKARIINRDQTLSSNKVVQLRAAASLGCLIPETLISNDKAKVVAFLNRFPDAIVKPLGVSYVRSVTALPDAHEDSFVSIMTNQVTVAEVAEASEQSHRSAPVIYQRRIMKRRELRVVAFGRDQMIFTVDSQRLRRTSLDWRRGEATPGLFKLVSANSYPSLLTFIPNFLDKLNLDTGVFDFAETESGGLVFFECNPAGQWAILDEVASGQVAEMFAKGINAISNKASQLCSKT